MKTYVFKVKLLVSPPASCDIEMRADQTLGDLSDAIGRAFNWDDDHLYAFYMTNKAWDHSGEYSHPYADGRDATATTMESLGLRRRKTFLYIFDFGDEWRHSITLVDKIEDAEEGEDVVYPRIIAREGDAPPQYWSEEDDWDEDEDE